MGSGRGAVSLLMAAMRQVEEFFFFFNNWNGWNCSAEPLSPSSGSFSSCEASIPSTLYVVTSELPNWKTEKHFTCGHVWQCRGKNRGGKSAPVAHSVSLASSKIVTPWFCCVCFWFCFVLLLYYKFKHCNFQLLRCMWSLRGSVDSAWIATVMTLYFLFPPVLSAGGPPGESLTHLFQRAAAPERTSSSFILQRSFQQSLPSVCSL